MMNTARILVVSSSLSPHSRSRVMAREAARMLASHGADIEWLDLADLDLRPYPRSEQDEAIAAARDAFEAADGIVLATPVYNWGPGASLTNFLHYILDPEHGRRLRPFVVLASAGSTRAHLALESVGLAMRHEVHGVQIGPPVVGTSIDIDRDSGRLADALRDRLNRTMEAFVGYAAAVADRRPTPSLV